MATEPEHGKVGGKRHHAGNTEECLAELSRLRDNPGPEARGVLRHYLGHRSNAVAARASKIVAALGYRDLGPQLASEFRRLMKKPAVSDPGCGAKTEIVRALVELGAAEDGVFLAGVRHVQMEGSFGPPVDTAPGLRAASAMGLVQMYHPDATLEIVRLLADREPDARIGAIRALAASGKPESVPLLRLKTLHGDQSFDVIAECFAALLQLDPAKSVEFVAEYLNGPDGGLAEAAAMALGQSREAPAIEVLKERWRPATSESMRRALLMALALARDERAFEFLFRLIESAHEKTAAEAVSALAIFRHDDAIRSRVESLGASRKIRYLTEAIHAHFGPNP